MTSALPHWSAKPLAASDTSALPSWSAKPPTASETSAPPSWSAKPPAASETSAQPSWSAKHPTLPQRPLLHMIGNFAAICRKQRTSIGPFQIHASIMRPLPAGLEPSHVPSLSEDHARTTSLHNPNPVVVDLFQTPKALQLIRKFGKHILAPSENCQRLVEALTRVAAVTHDVTTPMPVFNAQGHTL